MMEDKLFYLMKDWGFPMVMCFLLWYQANITIKQNTKVIGDIRDFLMFGKVHKVMK